MINSFKTYTHEHGGRVAVLFLLFLMAIYLFATGGFNLYAIFCLSPLAIVFIYCSFKWKMMCFWILFFFNYFMQCLNKNMLLPDGIPISAYSELLEILLIAIALIDDQLCQRLGRAMNMMLFAVLIWCGLCALQLLNDTCGLGINVSRWFAGMRLLALQLVYFVVIFAVYIDSPESLTKYLRIWAILSLFSAYWTWKQINIGFTHHEQGWLYGPGSVTHLVNGITRYFSTFNDAANYGCNAAATSAAFYILALTTKFRIDKILFFITATAVLWGMFQSGTRTAIAVFFAGLIAYVFLSKSVKLATPIIIMGILSFFMLVFTNIGQGNDQIRRMRSAFSKNDASANVRDINKQSIKKYLKEAPWGIGIAVNTGDVPARNKYNILSITAPDSEYVYIWIHTGIVGITVFVICIFIMLIGACRIVIFKLKNKTLIGVGAGLCSAFAAMQLAGYMNQVLYQFPNGLLFFGGLAIVYILPYIEDDFEKYEQTRLAKIEERKRLKLEKKLASRV